MSYPVEVLKLVRKLAQDMKPFPPPSDSSDRCVTVFVCFCWIKAYIHIHTTFSITFNSPNESWGDSRHSTDMARADNACKTALANMLLALQAPAKPPFSPARSWQSQCVCPSVWTRRTVSVCHKFSFRPNVLCCLNPGAFSATERMHRETSVH